MTDPYNLGRFVEAQEAVLPNVRAELSEGRKRSHWMWFIFPQLAGLGQSAMAKHFGISSLGEAEAYLGHAILGPRLIELAELVNSVEDRSVNQIFGSPDDHLSFVPQAPGFSLDRRENSSCTIYRNNLYN